MVSLIDDFKKYILSLKNELLANYNLECFCYFYLSHQINSNVSKIFVDKLEKSIESFIGEEKLAAIGYCCYINCDSMNINSKELRNQLEVVLNTEPLGGMHYSTNIYTLLGIYLLAKKINPNFSKLEPYLNKTISKGDLKDKFLLLYPDKRFINFPTIDSLQKPLDFLIYYFINSFNKIPSLQDMQTITNKFIQSWQEVIATNIDLVDIFLVEHFLTDSLKQNFQYETFDAVSLIQYMLSNFHNAITKITRNRRRGHQEFQINDEYDTQDLIYVMLKPIFSDLTTEEPTPKTGGKVNIMDFIIPKEKVGIEIKYLYKRDENENKLVKGLKEDIQSYYKYPDLDYIIIFVNDPFQRTRDKNNFYDLAGRQEIKGKPFEVKVIVTP